MKIHVLFENQLPTDKKITATRSGAWLDENTMMPQYSVQIKFKDTKYGHLLNGKGEVMFFQTKDEAKSYGMVLKKKHNTSI